MTNFNFFQFKFLHSFSFYNLLLKFKNFYIIIYTNFNKQPQSNFKNKARYLSHLIFSVIIFTEREGWKKKKKIKHHVLNGKDRL